MLVAMETGCRHAAGMSHRGGGKDGASKKKKKSSRLQSSAVSTPTGTPLTHIPCSPEQRRGAARGERTCVEPVTDCRTQEHRHGRTAVGLCSCL